MEKLDEVVSLQNQVRWIGFQDKLGKQNFHENMRKLFEPSTKSIKDVSEHLTKTLTETSNKEQ